MTVVVFVRVFTTDPESRGFGQVVSVTGVVALAVVLHVGAVTAAWQLYGDRAAASSSFRARVQLTFWGYVAVLAVTGGAAGAVSWGGKGIPVGAFICSAGPLVMWGMVSALRGPATPNRRGSD